MRYKMYTLLNLHTEQSKIPVLAFGFSYVVWSSLVCNLKKKSLEIVTVWLFFSSVQNFFKEKTTFYNEKKLSYFNCE